MFLIRVMAVTALVLITSSVAVAQSTSMDKTSVAAGAADEFSNAQLGGILLKDPFRWVDFNDHDRTLEEWDIDESLDFVCRVTTVAPPAPRNRLCGARYCYRIDCRDRETGIHDDRIHYQSPAWICGVISCA